MRLFVTKVYGESSVGRDSGCTEASTLEPTNPYSAAKAGAGMGVCAALLHITLLHACMLPVATLPFLVVPCLRAMDWMMLAGCPRHSNACMHVGHSSIWHAAPERGG